MKQRRKARRTLYLVIAFSCLLLLIGGSYLVYAAMTATDREENDFRVGQVETKIIEDFEFRTEIPKDVSIKKEVSIKNTGTINQFIRVMVSPQVQAEIAGDIQNKQILPLKIGTDLILEEMTASDWLDGGDGYYYYIKEAVKPGKETSELFKKVKLSDQLRDQYHGSKLMIILKAETINCAEFAYRDSWWQGNTPTTGSLKDVDDALKTKVDK
ncbi:MULTISPECIES: hypothetical protein [Enterococcus]|uniref:Alternate signal-mediated exported protein, CPF_0494 family n=1 Tax=Candidatus Enterococcus ferrettii TaxID=2815324 RepID=A0ABV0EM84_9ENTE|nr:hypothetical protein [Enterococcus sp. 665A]MBO1339045.1 hypothetical protein [Enterococcus sp. 665A]